MTTGRPRRSRGISRRALLVTAALLVVPGPAALAQYPGPAGTGASHACTAIGCQSGVFFDGGAYIAAHANAHRVRVCALGRCRSTGRGANVPAGEPLVLAIGREQTITITVTVLNRRGGALLLRKLVVALRKVQPNGPQCQPVCFEANVRLSSGGVLTERHR